jgi:delta-aminolevulinic acid dehydratase/porphobilinogen synthase
MGIHRGRRLRRTPAMRAMVAETQLAAAQLIAPLFVIDARSLSAHA